VPQATTGRTLQRPQRLTGSAQSQERDAASVLQSAKNAIRNDAELSFPLTCPVIIYGI
jgi:hypothetical protein